MQTKVSSINKKKYLSIIGMFFLFFIMLFVFRQMGEFLDEADNFLGGITVANGGHIYKEFYSQHTPGMYYLCSIFSLLGAKSILGFRILFYFTLSLIWVVMYCVYYKDFGRKTMFLYPISYICIMATLELGYTALSDVVQAQAMVILFLEFLRYVKTRKIEIKNSIMISIAIFTSVSVAFVSVFAIAAIVVGIFFIEIKESLSKKCMIKEVFKKMYCKYWKTILIIIAPFALLLTYYAFIGTLGDAYEQAFKFNREIYSKYTQGFGNNAIKNAINTINLYFANVDSTISNMGTNTLYQIRVIINILINIYFLTMLYNKKQKDIIFIVIAFVLLTGIRSFAGFHSVPYWAVTSMMGLISINEWLVNSDRNTKLKYINKNRLIIILSIIVITTPYLKIASNIVPNKQDLFGQQYTEPSLEYYINKLTNKDDTIYISSLAATSYIKTQRKPASRIYCITPWFMEWYGNDLIEDLEGNKPKLIEYNDANEVWGHKIKDSAINFDSYVRKNYTLLNVQQGALWVRNDFYEEACNILSIKEPAFSVSSQEMTIVGPLRDGKDFTQVVKLNKDIINKIKMQIGTYQRSNKSQLKMTISDIEKNKILYETDIDVPNIKDNAMEEIDIPGIQIEKGKEYAINFRAFNTKDNDYITIYRTKENLNEDSGYTMIDGVKQSYNFNIIIY